MIAQYLIDWASIETRVDNATAVGAMKLCGQLTLLREKIEKNGVVIVDDDSRLIKRLQDTISLLRELTEDVNEEGYSDLILELECFQNVYENRQYFVGVSEEQEALAGCVAAWNEHIRPISQQGVAGGVVITDASELNLGSLKVETIDSYENSDTEHLRREWSTGRCFNAQSEREFHEYLNAFAATTSGEVLFVDPYWGAVGKTRGAGAETTQQRRWLNSTAMFVKPLVTNADVTRIDFLTEFPDGLDGNGFSTERLGERLRSLTALRNGELTIKITFVTSDVHPDPFHNRYLVNEMYTMALPDGMDVCDPNGRMEEFTAVEFGVSRGGRDEMKRGMVVNCRKREIMQEEIDLIRPYVLVVRDRPLVRLMVNG